MRGRLVAADSALQYAVAQTTPGWRGADVTLAELAERRGDHAEAARRASALVGAVRERRGGMDGGRPRRCGSRVSPAVARQCRRRCEARSPRSTPRTRPIRPISTRGCAPGELFLDEVQRARREVVVRRGAAQVAERRARAARAEPRRGVLRRRAVHCPARAARSPPIRRSSTRGWRRRALHLEAESYDSAATAARARARGGLVVDAGVVAARRDRVARAATRRSSVRRSRRRSGSTRGRPSSTPSSRKRR